MSKWLSEISPREAWLEREYTRLKGEVDWLRKSKGIDRIRFHVDSPPETLDMRDAHETLVLAVEARLEETKSRELHVFVAERGCQEAVGLRYYVSPLVHRSEAQRAALMIEMHNRLVFDIGQKFWGSK